jgi:hypothetical protein
MPRLSSRERLKRTFRCQPVDRMPIRLWGVDPMFATGKPTWAPLFEMVEQHELDIVREWSATAEDWGRPVSVWRSERRESDRPEWWLRVETIDTSAGPLTRSSYEPKDGRPGYWKKRPIETVEDARRWLSIPFREPRFATDSYFDLERKSGDRALLMVFIDEAFYAVQRLLGSETLALWLIDERPLLKELIEHEFRQIEAEVKRYLAHGVGDAFGWVGPELCIPPLASPRDFREFVVAYDKRLVDLIHDAGKLVWLHCHGDMQPVLEDFIEMGVDCLNPIQGPPVGGLTLAEAKARVAGRMALEGNVENGDFDRLRPEQMEQVVAETVHQGKPGGGFILCPTSDPNTWASLNRGHIDNFRAFVETGLRLADYGV